MSGLHKKSQRLSRYNLTRTTCICMLVMAERYNLLYELVREPKVHVVQRGRHHPTPPSLTKIFFREFHACFSSIPVPQINVDPSITRKNIFGYPPACIAPTRWIRYVVHWIQASSLWRVSILVSAITFLRWVDWCWHCRFIVRLHLLIKET